MRVRAASSLKLSRFPSTIIYLSTYRADLVNDAASFDDMDPKNHYKYHVIIKNIFKFKIFR